MASAVVVMFIGTGWMVIDTIHRFEPKRFCPGDGLIGSAGQSYTRDPNQDCKFVDADGNVFEGQ